MFCGKCGQENSDGVKFCVHCGADLARQTPPPRTPTPPRAPTPADTLDNARTIAGQEVGPGRVLAGRFEILQRLGAGGMGEVFKAEDREMDGLVVAVKVLPPVLARNKHSIEALKREAAIALRLTHPRICRLHQFYADGDTKFLVMEHIDGRTVEDMLDAKPGRRMPLAELLPIARDLAEALDFAHSLQPPVLHRDIKPSNIMVSPDGRAKVLDFGIAREMKDSMTRVTGRETSGTLLYMSPEQFSGKPLGPASDNYAFAATLYECLGGHPPFHRGSIGHQLLYEPPAPIEGLPEPVNEALRAGLAKEPEDRPATACELVQRLAGEMAVAIPMDEVLAPAIRPASPQPTAAPPAPLPAAPPAATPPARPKRRGWLVAAMVTLILLGGMAGLAYLGMTYFLQRSAAPAVPAVAEKKSTDGAVTVQRLATPAVPAEAEKGSSGTTVMVQRPATPPTPVVPDTKDRDRAQKIADLLARARANESDSGAPAALAALDELLAIQSGNQEALALRQGIQSRIAAKTARDTADREKAQKIADLLMRARANATRTNAAAALAALKELLQLDSTNAEALQLQAKVKAMLGPQTLTVPDDYQSIQKAINDAAAGDTIRVKAGVYEEALIFKDGIRLVGEGFDRVTVRCPPSRNALCVQDCRSGLVSGLTFEHLKTGENTNLSVVFIVNSSIELLRCKVQNGALNGIDIIGQCGTTVRECMSQANAKTGIIVGESVAARLEQNLCADNGLVGIAYIKGAGGTAEGNTCRNNKEHGIAVFGQGTKPDLRKNTCVGNGLSGIAFLDGAAGTAQGNNCQGNKLQGILSFGSGTAPTLRENTCRGNGFSGICFDSGGGGTADTNICAENTQSGIIVSGQGTAATLTKNECHRNGLHGILVQFAAGARIDGNGCAENKFSGICALNDGTMVLVSNNICRGNQLDGIAVERGAGGSILDNTCETNKVAGIAVCAARLTEVRRNRCVGNLKFGIAFDAATNPAIFMDNILGGNPGGDIQQIIFTPTGPP